MPTSDRLRLGTAADLIENIELESLDGDKFAHRVLVEELSSLATSVSTPANIALFGPWGSGKSSIVKLLKDELQSKDHRRRGVRVAKFDAFKYASSSFRRHLLRQVASETLPRKPAEAFSQSLYQKEESSQIDLSNVRKGHLWLVIAAVFGGPAAFGILIGLIEMLLQWAGGATLSIAAQSFVPVAIDTARKIFAWAAIPGAVVGLVGSLLGSTLPVTRTMNQPTSEEEFEQKFNELLDLVDCKRLVVLVDELDRCSPRQVVDVLDALRTFLFVPKTIFIVAADQFVLEKALSIELTREFPMEHEVAPYTVGHSHLDKTFQYQLSIPPLLAARVTRFAIELVEGRGGIWESEGFDKDQLMSVLIPSHVRSPRRVKALINNFVLLYRLARHHREEERLSRDPEVSYLELAKLVALRTEFPIFARDLTIGSRLPKLLLQIADGVDVRPENVPEYLWKRAREYFDGDRQVAVPVGLDASSSIVHPPNVEPADSPADDRHAKARPAAPLNQSPSRHLIRYLQKTRTVADPRADYVFLENRGNLFGLDEATAEQVLDLALDASVNELVAVVSSMQDQDRVPTIRFLASRAQDAEPGVEGTNLLMCLFALCEELDLSILAEVEVLQVVTNTVVVAGELRDEWIGGGLRVALAFPDRVDLVNRLLRDRRIEASHEMGLLLIEAADTLRSFQEVLASRWVTLLIRADTAHSAVQAAQGLETKSILLDSASNDIRKQIANWPVEVEQEYPFHLALDAAIAVEDLEIASRLIAALYSVGDPEWYEAVAPYLKVLGPSSDNQEAFLDALGAVSKSTPAGALATLRALPDGIATRVASQQGSNSLTKQVWGDRVYYLQLESGRGLQEVFGELLRVGLIRADETALIDAVRQDMPSAPSTQALLESILDNLDVIGDLFESNVMSPRVFAEDVTSTLVRCLGATLEAVSPELQGRIITWLEWVSEHGTSKAVNSLTKRVLTCKWINGRRGLAVRLVGAAAESGREGLRFPLESPRVIELVQSNPKAEASMASTWLEHFCDNPEHLLTIASAYRSGYGSVRSAVRSCAQRMSAAERLAVLESALSIAVTHSWAENLVADIAEGPMSEPAQARSLAKLYAELGTSNARRKPFFIAWGKAGFQSNQQKKSLVRNVMIPTLDKGGAEGLRLVHKHRHLLVGISGIKRELETALRPLRSERNQGKIDDILQALEEAA